MISSPLEFLSRLGKFIYMNRLAQAVDYLKSLNTQDIQFFERKLLSHLMGTHDILRTWGVNEHLSLAGLFHAIYLTDFFSLNDPRPENRALVKTAIGSDAEEIVYRYCVMDRRAFIEQRGNAEAIFDSYAKLNSSITAVQEYELVELIWANAFEQLRYEEPPFESCAANKILFENSAHRVRPNALKHFREFYAEIDNKSLLPVPKS